MYRHPSQLFCQIRRDLSYLCFLDGFESCKENRAAELSIFVAVVENAETKRVHDSSFGREMTPSKKNKMGRRLFL